MNRPTGLLLRLVGPAVEIGAVLLLRRLGDRGLSVAGLPVEYLCYAGMAAGLLMVIAGLALSRGRRDLGPKELR